MDDTLNELKEIVKKNADSGIEKAQEDAGEGGEEGEMMKKTRRRRGKKKRRKKTEVQKMNMTWI